jgi:circadian clock protein KaiB
MDPGAPGTSASELTGDVAPTTLTQEFEQALAAGFQSAFYSLELYVAGAAPRSLRAIAIVRKLCEEHLAGRYDLQVVDIYQEPFLAEQEGIVAVPALIRRQPLPALRLVGDMSDVHRVRASLGIPPGRTGGEAV